MATAKLATSFSDEELAVNDSLGYPKAYAKLCSSRRAGNTNIPYSLGPPQTFLPYTLQPHQALQAKDMNQMFPTIDPEAVPSVNPRGFVNLLWKQLDHLGNAGFDPALFRVDPYGNVLYLHADSASPLAWDIDHWFPCSRGGRTVPNNLRLLQWQVCKKKHNKLEFLIPWWDLQLGISVNQFLSIFASRNSDFKKRAFSYLFADGGYEDLCSLQSVEAHSFPKHFVEMKRQIGLAPAAIVSSPRSSDASVLKSVDLNRSLSHKSPLASARKLYKEDDDCLSLAITSQAQDNSYISKENDDSSTETNENNPYLSIVMARDSLKLREETKKKQLEMSQLENELNELKQSNETERLALQELETVLIRRRRRVEKCRRLAEAQSSYKALLEKMIRDAMHQSVVYKEQLRLNQAATSALMARLEAQRAVCDSSEKELRRKFKQRDEIEKRIRPMWELRKRSRVDDDSLFTERRTSCPLKKELRIFLEEEQRTSEAGPSLVEAGETSEENETSDSTENDLEGPLKFDKDDFALREKETEATDSKPNKNIDFSSTHMGVEHDDDGRTTTSKKTNYQSTNTDGECSKYSEMRKQKLSSCEDEAQAYKQSGFAKKAYHPSATNTDGEHSRNREMTKQKLSSCEDEGQAYKQSEYANMDGECSRNGEMKKQQLSSCEDGQSCKQSGFSEDLATQRNYPIKPLVAKMKSPILHDPLTEDDEEHRNEAGKGNIDKWLHMLLEGTNEGPSFGSSPSGNPSFSHSRAERNLHKLNNTTSTKKEINFLSLKELEEKSTNELTSHIRTTSCIDSMSNQAFTESNTQLPKRNKEVRAYESISSGRGGIIWNRKSFDVKERGGKKGLPRSESGRGFLSLPSSPSMMLGMRRGVECIGSKPKVSGNNDNEIGTSATSSYNNKFIESCKKAIKKAVHT